MSTELTQLTTVVENQEKAILRLERTLEKNNNEMTAAMKEVSKSLVVLSNHMTERTVIDGVFEKRISILEKRLNTIEKISILTDNFRQSFLKIGLPIITLLISSAIIGGLMIKLK